MPTELIVDNCEKLVKLRKIPYQFGVEIRYSFLVLIGRVL